MDDDPAQLLLIRPRDEISDDAPLAALAERPELAWWEIPELPVEDDPWVEQVGELVGLIRAHDDRPTQMYFWTRSTAEHIAAYVPDVSVISPGTYPAHACQVQPWIRWRIASARETVEMAGYTDSERPVVGTADLYARAETSCPERATELNLQPEWKASALDTAELISGESGLGFAAARGYAGTRFVVAVNYTDEAVTAEIAGLPAEHLGIEVVGEDRSLTSSGGVMTDAFEAGAAHVYRSPIVRAE